MAKTYERRVAEALDRTIRGRAYGVTRLAKQMEVAPRTIDRWCADEVSPTAGQLLQIVECIATVEPAKALALLDDLLGCPGFAAHKAFGAETKVGDAREEAADVTEAAAELQHEVREATKDGAIDAAEQARIATAARRVHRETAEVPGVVQALGTLERPLFAEARL
jgi:hypothetical protein